MVSYMHRKDFKKLSSFFLIFGLQAEKLELEKPGSLDVLEL